MRITAALMGVRLAAGTGLEFYVRRNGTTTYNHVGMRSHGRELSTYAMYQQRRSDVLLIESQRYVVVATGTTTTRATPTAT